MIILPEKRFDAHTAEILSFPAFSFFEQKI